jgi:hypothetical protein
MNLHLHPSRWLEHQHINREHLREIFHNEVLWVVLLALIIFTGLLVLTMIFSGKVPTMNMPHILNFPLR